MHRLHIFPINSLVQLLSWAFWKISSNGKWLLSPISSQGPKSTLYEQDPTFWFDRLVVRIPEFSREHLENKWLHAWSNIVYKSPYSSGTHIMGLDQSLSACFSYFIRGKSLINMGPLIFVSLCKLLGSGTQISPISPNWPFHTYHSFHWIHN